MTQMDSLFKFHGPAQARVKPGGPKASEFRALGPGPSRHFAGIDHGPALVEQSCYVSIPLCLWIDLLWSKRDFLSFRRVRRGIDIDAGCGQLTTKVLGRAGAPI